MRPINLGATSLIKSASVIGRRGNPYHQCITTFDIIYTKYEQSALKPVKGSSYVRVPANRIPHDVNKASTALVLGLPKLFPSRGSPTSNGVMNNVTRSYYRTSNGRITSSGAKATKNGNDSGEEIFIDVYKSVIKTMAPVAGNSLKSGSPIVLGPIVGGPVGALASVALSAAGQYAESVEKSLDGEPNYDGIVERAIFGEAVLAAVISREGASLEKLAIFDEMSKVVNQLNPTINQAASYVLGAVMEPALRVTLDALDQATSNHNAEWAAPEVPISGRSMTSKNASSRKVIRTKFPGSDQFVADLEAKLGESDNEEYFFGEFANFASRAFKQAGPTLGTVAKTGLLVLLKAISGGAKSTADDEATPIMSPLNDLSKRAMLGEAALQALVKLPSDFLEEEGVFDQIVSAMKRITPVVLHTAPGVINTVTPIVDRFMKKSSRADPSKV